MDWSTRRPQYQAIFQARWQEAVRTVPQSLIPEGCAGAWEVSKFELTEEASEWPLVRAVVKGERGYTPPGRYTRLTHDTRGVVMSDTLDELRDLIGFVRRVRGSVLINGLGLGVCVGAVLNRQEVTKVTVIELDSDVIRLVAPHIIDPRLTIVEADALTWRPAKNEYFDCVWHDVWDEISADNLPQIRLLHRRYGKRAAWQGTWARDVAEKNR